MPFFSIIIPTYNRAHLLGKALQSIQAQTISDWECIVVDDGSTDKTQELMQAWVKKDARFRYVFQENAERSAARNNGIRNTRGNYICFLDSDDAYCNKYLEELKIFLKNRGKPEALVVSDFFLWDGEHFEPKHSPEPGGNPAEWLFNYPASPSRVCVHNKILSKYKFREDIVVVEDSVLWVTITNEFPVLHIAEPLIYYRVHNENSVNPLNNSNEKRLAGLKLFFKDPLSNALSNSFKRKLISGCYAGMGQFYFSLGRKRKAFKNISLAIMYFPFDRQTKARFFIIFSLLPGFEYIWRSFKKPTGSH